MSRVRSFQFGCGSLESVRLRMWALLRRHESHTMAIKVRADGTYRVYCGAGWEHTVDIDEQHTFDLERPTSELDQRLAVAWIKGDQDAADGATRLLVDWALEAWNDPCLGAERARG